MRVRVRAMSPPGGADGSSEGQGVLGAEGGTGGAASSARRRAREGEEERFPPTSGRGEARPRCSSSPLSCAAAASHPPPQVLALVPSLGGPPGRP